MRRESPALYLNAATIAKQLWCHQYAIFKMRRERAIIRKVIEKLKKLPKNRIRIARTETQAFMPIDSNDPFETGVLAEAMVGKKYASELACFRWKRSLILCAPDGLPKGGVYEFKTAKNPFWAGFTKPVARLQAHIYGYFFERSKIRVEIWDRESDAMITLSEPTDQALVESRLQQFCDLVLGVKTPIPPKAVKCSSCEFLSKCTITPMR